MTTEYFLPAEKSWGCLAKLGFNGVDSVVRGVDNATVAVTGEKTVGGDAIRVFTAQAHGSSSALLRTTLTLLNRFGHQGLREDVADWQYVGNEDKLYGPFTLVKLMEWRNVPQLASFMILNCSTGLWVVFSHLMEICDYIEEMTKPQETQIDPPEHTSAAKPVQNEHPAATVNQPITQTVQPISSVAVPIQQETRLQDVTLSRSVLRPTVPLASPPIGSPVPKAAMNRPLVPIPGNKMWVPPVPPPAALSGAVSPPTPLLVSTTSPSIPALISANPSILPTARHSGSVPVVNGSVPVLVEMPSVPFPVCNAHHKPEPVPVPSETPPVVNVSTPLLPRAVVRPAIPDPVGFMAQIPQIQSVTPPPPKTASEAVSRTPIGMTLPAVSVPALQPTKPPPVSVLPLRPKTPVSTQSLQSASNATSLRESLPVILPPVVKPQAAVAVTTHPVHFSAPPILSAAILQTVSETGPDSVPVARGDAQPVTPPPPPPLPPGANRAVTPPVLKPQRPPPVPTLQLQSVQPPPVGLNSTTEMPSTVPMTQPPPGVNSQIQTVAPPPLPPTAITAVPVPVLKPQSLPLVNHQPQPVAPPPRVPADNGEPPPPVRNTFQPPPPALAPRPPPVAERARQLAPAPAPAPMRGTSLLPEPIVNTPQPPRRPRAPAQRPVRASMAAGRGRGQPRLQNGFQAPAPIPRPYSGGRGRGAPMRGRGGRGGYQDTRNGFPQRSMSGGFVARDSVSNLKHNLKSHQLDPTVTRLIKQLTEAPSRTDSQKWEDLLDRAQNCLKDGFSGVVEHSLAASFGRLWKDVLKAKPPWEGKDILTLLSAHRNAVFDKLMTRQLQDLVDHFRYYNLDVLQDTATPETTLRVIALARDLFGLYDFKPIRDTPAQSLGMGAEDFISFNEASTQLNAGREAIRGLFEECVREVEALVGAPSQPMPQNQTHPEAPVSHSAPMNSTPAPASSSAVGLNGASSALIPEQSSQSAVMTPNADVIWVRNLLDRATTRSPMGYDLLKFVKTMVASICENAQRMGRSLTHHPEKRAGLEQIKDRVHGMTSALMTVQQDLEERKRILPETVKSVCRAMRDFITLVKLDAYKYCKRLQMPDDHFLKEFTEKLNGREERIDQTVAYFSNHYDTLCGMLV